MLHGYFTQFGYRGLVGGRYMLFATEEDYLVYLKGEDDET